MRILVGIDGEDGGRDALALARVLGGTGAELTVAHVLPGDGHPTRGANLAFDAGARDEAHALLEREVAGLAAAHQVIEAASVGAGLRQLADDAAVDLVAVGTSRSSPLARLLGGDDARGTIREARRPVAVAPRGYASADTAVQRVGVGFDESPEARGALALARELATAHDAALIVVEAVEVASWLIDPAVAPALVADAERRRTAAQQRLDQLPGIEGRATMNLSLDSMRDLAGDVDLLVVGWRSHGWIERAMEGSTGEALSHDPACPVIVVPAPPAPH